MEELKSGKELLRQILAAIKDRKREELKWKIKELEQEMEKLDEAFEREISELEKHFSTDISPHSLFYTIDDLAKKHCVNIRLSGKNRIINFDSDSLPYVVETFGEAGSSRSLGINVLPPDEEETLGVTTVIKAVLRGEGSFSVY